MAVMLTPEFEAQRLVVEGDVQASLPIPAEPAESYVIAFSDGTIVRASLNDRPDFHVVVEGAGIVRIDDVNGSFAVDWDVEWVTVASQPAGAAFAAKEPARLPLFEGLSEAA